MLKENWPDLGTVTSETIAAPEADITSDDVQKVLDQIMPAIKGFGGSVDILSVEGTIVKLSFKGPERLRKGIYMALKENLKSVTAVDFL